MREITVLYWLFNGNSLCLSLSLSLSVIISQDEKKFDINISITALLYNQRTSLIIFWSIFCKITLNFFFFHLIRQIISKCSIVGLSLTCNQEYKKSLVVYVFKSFSLIQSTRQHMYACWHHPWTTFQETSFTVSHNFIKFLWEKK